MNDKKEATKPYKRVLAWVGIVVLVGMYLLLLYEALTGSPDTYNVFIGCVAATIAVPILLWLLIWAIGALTGRHTVASLDPMTSNKKHDKYGNVVPESEIDTVVFDIGNVLTNFAWDQFLENKGYDKEMVERMGRASVYSKDWVEFDKGDLTTEQICQRFADNDPEIGEELKSAFSDLTDVVTKREEAIPWIQALKAAGYRVLVLSNFSKQALEGCRDAMSFLDVVDGGILSYRDHVVKPDEAIYKLLMERYELVPEKTVFIDDTPANIKTARSLGWHGIDYRNYDQVVEELHNLGVRY
jgi:epoxide hydrolase-like predicted phosphatase